VVAISIRFMGFPSRVYERCAAPSVPRLPLSGNSMSDRQFRSSIASLKVIRARKHGVRRGVALAV
jgi:hypothetical protein